MNIFKKFLGLLKKDARLGDETAKQKLDELGVNQHKADSFAVGLEREKLERCLQLTFELHDSVEGRKLSEQLINDGVKDIIPWLCLSAIYGTLEEWNKCAYFSLKGLEYNENHTMLLNHLGVSMCYESDRNGLDYLKRGMILGDEGCKANYEHWRYRM
jgi:hypothetical protein